MSASNHDDIVRLFKIKQNYYVQRNTSNLSTYYLLSHSKSLKENYTRFRVVLTEPKIKNVFIYMLKRP